MKFGQPYRAEFGRELVRVFFQRCKQQLEQQFSQVLQILRMDQTSTEQDNVVDLLPWTISEDLRLEMAKGWDVKMTPHPFVLIQSIYASVRWVRTKERFVSCYRIEILALHSSFAGS